MIRLRDTLFGAALGFGLGSLAAFAGGCAEPAFSAHLRDNNVDDIAHALALSGKGAAPHRPTAYLVTAGDKRLVSYDLESGEVKWDVPAEVSSRVAVGSGFLAHRIGGAAPGAKVAEKAQSIVVRSTTTGAQRCVVNLKAGEQFLGLTADTRVYYVVQTLTGETRVSSLIAISPDTCAEAWRDDATGSIGAPAARGEVVAVPYAYQNIVLLDGKTGVELARVRATDSSLSYVRATSEGFFYGDNKGVYLLNPKSAGGSKKASAYVEAHLASSQIRTFFYWDAYQPSQADYTAFDRNRLLWRAESRGDGVAFHDDTALLHSYRYFFAFDAASGDLRWAYAHPRVDLVGSDDTGPAVVYASVDGEVGALDARNGATVWSKKTDLKLAGATFDAEGFTPPSSSGAAAPKLMTTLGSIVADPDARFTAVKVFSVAAMTRVPGPEATAELVKVVTKPGIAPVVQKAAAEALVARADASSKNLYHDALAVHNDYLNDRHPRGVDALAKVEATIGDQAAAPLLASHLLDPATPLPALKEIVKALVTLGGPESLAALRDLLLTYRSDASFLTDPLSLELAAEGLLKLGGPEGRRTVLFVLEEPRTTPALASYIQRVLEPGAPAAPRKDAPPVAQPPKTKEKTARNDAR